MPEYVWYACYGSNLAERRFKCYIDGSSFRFSDGREEQINPGCNDTNRYYLKNNGVDKGKYKYRLFFSKDSPKRWKGAFGFIEDKPVSKKDTWFSMYKLTTNQFGEVFQQENGVKNKQEFKTIQLSIEELRFKKFCDIKGLGLYDRIIYMGEHNPDNYPILTFTSSNTSSMQRKIPGSEYRVILREGLKDIFQTQEEIEKYLDDHSVPA